MKIIVSLETKESIDIAHRVVDYVDGFKINHMLWDEIIAWPKHWTHNKKQELFIDFKLWDTPNTVETVVKKVIDKGGTMVSICAHNSQETFERLKLLSDSINVIIIYLILLYKIKVFKTFEKIKSTSIICSL